MALEFKCCVRLDTEYVTDRQAGMLQVPRDNKD